MHFVFSRGGNYGGNAETFDTLNTQSPHYDDHFRYELESDHFNRNHRGYRIIGKSESPDVAKEILERYEKERAQAITDDGPL